MKNLKVRTKMLLGFILVTLLTVIVGVVSIINLTQLNDDYTYAVDTHGKPLVDAGHVVSDLHAIRAEIRLAMVFSGDVERVATQRTLVQGFMDDFEASAAKVEPFYIREDVKAMYNDAMEIYNTTFVPNVETLLTDAENGVEPTQLAAFMASNLKPAIDSIIADFEQCMAIKLEMLDTTSAAGAATAQSTLIILIVLLVVSATISITLGLYISSLISKPLAVLTTFMKKAGTTGDITLTAEDQTIIQTFGKVKDETGQTISASAAFVTHVIGVSKTLETVANGDLSVEVHPISDRDVLGLSLQKMTNNLNTMFEEINTASSQVSTGSHQVADGAQALASGSTEQAASVQELSSSISEVAERTKENSVKADQAASLADTIKGSAEKGSGQMDDMIKSVKDINEASQSIGKVIKTIDDIAFQTNILALNAAVEAARAGQHGKGFAVVAEEVRNLSAKSAQAAKDTESLIEDSMQKAQHGVNIAGETATSLSEIVSGINQSSALITEIARASEEQSMSISQINTGIDQVAKVVQQNSATAEESAAASEEMSSQSAVLRELIAQFKLKNDIGQRRPAVKGGPEPRRLTAAEEEYLAHGDGSFGKY